jgi:hypothetical protein
MVDRKVYALEAARSVLVELIDLLNEHRASAVVIGGWTADLLPSKGIIPHAGTVDVDLVLDRREIADENEIAIMEVLLSKGYRKGKERFQFVRTVITDVGPVDVRVDYLTTETEKNAPGGSYRAVHGIDALTLRGGDLAFEQAWIRKWQVNYRTAGMSLSRFRSRPLFLYWCSRALPFSTAENGRTPTTSIIG